MGVENAEEVWSHKASASWAHDLREEYSELYGSPFYSSIGSNFPG